MYLSHGSEEERTVRVMVGGGEKRYREEALATCRATRW
jgi:hypothetical protein